MGREAELGKSKEWRVTSRRGLVVLKKQGPQWKEAEEQDVVMVIGQNNEGDFI